MKHIIIFNGAIGGAEGNTQKLLERAMQEIKKQKMTCEMINLCDQVFDIESILKKADGFIFSSGTYWDSWGSPMQKFLENLTPFEASPLLLGKPVSVLITMHSVGGKEVLSRLQGVLSTMGMLIPPMAGMAYSLAAKLALESNSSFSEDFWSLEDLNIIIENLAIATQLDTKYKAWPVDHKDPTRFWF
jgi:multimeric flavodoxin WrbA